MDDDNGINGRAEAWPPMGRRSSSIMHRPNVPPRISLPQASQSPSPSPSNSSSKSASSATSNAGYTLDPSYYASSPPPRGGYPTSAPLIRQRTAPADPSAPPRTPGLTNGEGNAAFRLPFIMRNIDPPSLLSPSCASTLSSDAEGRSSHHQHRGHERSDSTDTVRGPVLLTIPHNEDDSRASSVSSNYPLTPFPEYISQSSDDRSSMTGCPANTVLRTSSTAHGGEGQKHQLSVEETARRRGTRDGVRLVLLLREEDGDVGGAFPRFRRRLTSMSSSMHGFMLGLECMVLLVVGSALVWITVSKKTAADGDFWTWYVTSLLTPAVEDCSTLTTFKALDIWRAAGRRPAPPVLRHPRHTRGPTTLVRGAPLPPGSGAPSHDTGSNNPRGAVPRPRESRGEGRHHRLLHVDVGDGLPGLPPRRHRVEGRVWDRPRQRRRGC
jgi:hypothetical protein